MLASIDKYNNLFIVIFNPLWTQALNKRRQRTRL